MEKEQEKRKRELERIEILIEQKSVELAQLQGARSALKAIIEDKPVLTEQANNRGATTPEVSEPKKEEKEEPKK